MPRTPPIAVPGAVVAITGAARGIGLATAHAFIKAGARVAIGDLDLDLARAAAAEIGASAFAVDVSDVTSFTAFLDAVEAELGPLDVLVNNAGIMPLGPLTEEPEEVTQRIVSVNLLGAIHGTKLAMARMTSRNRGHIVNVASAVGRFAVPNAATYSASKFGVVGLTQAARGELRQTGVHASVVLPAMTRTDLVTGLAETRRQHIVEPEDVAAAVLEVVRKPVFERWVPRGNQRGFRVMSTLPYRWFEAAAHASGSARVLEGADPQARAAYEQRARRARDGSSPR